LACSALAFNAFNYRICGEAGFRAVARLAREASTWQLTYGRLEDALNCLDSLYERTLASPPRPDHAELDAMPEAG
jgi:hypothetical protein